MSGKRKYTGWKKLLAGMLVISIAFWSYVEIVNRNSKSMTGRQKIMKAVYPVWMQLQRLTGKKRNMEQNEKAVQPTQPVYSLPIVLNNGDTITLEKYKGKKIMLVNTASDCGYTPQYAGLQELYEQYSDRLVIIGFPANDFGEQERGSNEQIEQFCKVNFGVTFPLAKKSVVIKGDEQNDIFQWLSNKNRNGWNDEAPAWNFSKYLLNEQGVLTHLFKPAISPVSDEVLKAVKG